MVKKILEILKFENRIDHFIKEEEKNYYLNSEKIYNFYERLNIFAKYLSIVSLIIIFVLIVLTSLKILYLQDTLLINFFYIIATNLLIGLFIFVSFKKKYIIKRVKLVILLLSYFYLIMLYAYIYSYISILTNHFSKTGLEFVDYLYFSLITISTVGYGDITPITTLSKVLVMSEIIIGLVITIIGLSLVLATKNNDKKIIEALKYEHTKKK